MSSPDKTNEMGPHECQNERQNKNNIQFIHFEIINCSDQYLQFTTFLFFLHLIFVQPKNM